MICPLCATQMDEHARHGVKIDHCPACGGVWLDPGELDHLLAAVRPAVTLPDPEPPRPAPPPPPPSPAMRPEPRGERYTQPKAAKPTKFEDGENTKKKKSKKSGKSYRYSRRYSKVNRLKDVLEDIFDFD